MYANYVNICHLDVILFYASIVLINTMVLLAFQNNILLCVISYYVFLYVLPLYTLLLKFSDIHLMNLMSCRTMGV